MHVDEALWVDTCFFLLPKKLKRGEYLMAFKRSFIMNVDKMTAESFNGEQGLRVSCNCGFFGWTDKKYCPMCENIALIELENNVPKYFVDYTKLYDNGEKVSLAVGISEYFWLYPKMDCVGCKQHQFRITVNTKTGNPYFLKGKRIRNMINFNLNRVDLNLLDVFVEASKELVKEFVALCFEKRNIDLPLHDVFFNEDVVLPPFETAIKIIKNPSLQEEQRGELERYKERKKKQEEELKNAPNFLSNPMGVDLDGDEVETIDLDEMSEEEVDELAYMHSHISEEFEPYLSLRDHERAAQIQGMIAETNALIDLALAEGNKNEFLLLTLRLKYLTAGQ
jgi:hypothetical protein